MFGLVVTPFPHGLIVGLGVIGITYAATRLHEKIGDAGRIIAASLVIGRGRRCRESESGFCTVDGSRGRIFQHGNRFDVVGVDAVGIALHAIDKDQRAAAVGRTRAADLETGSCTGFARRNRHVEIGNHTLQSLSEIGDRAIFQLFRRDLCYCAGQIRFFLGAVTYDDHIVNQGVILS